MAERERTRTVPLSPRYIVGNETQFEQLRELIRGIPVRVRAIDGCRYLGGVIVKNCDFDDYSGLIYLDTERLRESEERVKKVFDKNGTLGLLKELVVPTRDAHKIRFHGEGTQDERLCLYYRDLVSDERMTVAFRLWDNFSFRY